MATLGELIVSVGASIDGFKSAMTDVSTTLDQISRDADRSFRGFDKLGSSLTELGTAMSLSITAPLLAASGAATKFAGDFDSQMRKVTSIISDVTERDFKSLSAQVLDLSKTMGVDAVKAADALYQALSTGIPKDNAVDFVRVASVAAIAGLTDTKVAVDGLTTVIQAFGLQVSDAKEISDAMFQAVNVGKLEFPELASAIGIAAGTAHALGVSYKELLAASATLTLSTGQNVTEAMTMLQSAMKALLKPTADMSQLLDALGYSSGSALIQAKGLEGALQAVSAAANGNVDTLTKAFGRVEGLRATLGLTGDNAQKAANQLVILQHSSDGAGAAANAFAEINKGFNRQLEIFTTNIKDVGIEFGQTLLPVLERLLEKTKPLIEDVEGMVKWFSALPEPIQDAAFAFGATLAVIGPLTVGLGLLITSATNVVTAFTALSAAMGSVLVPAIANISFALANNMVGALSLGEMALLRMGQAALVAGAAFAGWELGKWLRENVPIMKDFGDAIGEWILKIPGMEALLNKLGGVKDIVQPTKDLTAQVREAEASLRAQGIAIDQGGMTLVQYASHLADVKKSLMEHKDTTEKATKATGDFGASLRDAFEALGIKTAPTEAAFNKLATAMETIEKLYQSGKISAAQYDAAVEGFQKKIHELYGTMSEAQGPVDKFGDALKAAGISDTAANIERLNSNVAMAADIFAHGRITAGDYAGEIAKLNQAEAALLDPTKKANDAFLIAGNQLKSGTGTVGAYDDALQGLLNTIPPAQDAFSRLAAKVTDLSAAWLKQTVYVPTVDSALKNLGQKTMKELEVEARNAQADFDLLSEAFRNGEVSSQVLDAAWQKLHNSQLKLSQDKLDAQKLGIPDIDELDRAVKEANRAFEDLASHGLLNVNTGLEANIYKTHLAIDQAFQHGQSTTDLQIKMNGLTLALEHLRDGWDDSEKAGKQMFTSLAQASRDLLALNWSSLVGDLASIAKSFAGMVFDPKVLLDIRRALDTDLAKAIDDLIAGVGNLGDAFKKLGIDVLDIIVNKIIALGIQKMLDMLAGVGGILGSIGTALGGVAGGIAGAAGQVAATTANTTALAANTAALTALAGALSADTATQAASGAGGIATAGGGIGGAISAGLSGTISAISGVVTAIASVGAGITAGLQAATTNDHLFHIMNDTARMCNAIVVNGEESIHGYLGVIKNEILRLGIFQGVLNEMNAAAQNTEIYALGIWRSINSLMDDLVALPGQFANALASSSQTLSASAPAPVFKIELNGQELLQSVVTTLSQSGTLVPQA